MGYHTSKTIIPYQTPSPLHFITSFQTEKQWNCLSTQTPNYLVWILFWINILHPSSDSQLKTQAVYSSNTLLPRPQAILTQTVLCFFTTVKTWSKELGDITDKGVDGSCWENRISTTLFSLPTQYLMLQCFAPLLCYSLFYFPKWNKKGNCLSGNSSMRIQKGMER